MPGATHVFQVCAGLAAGSVWPVSTPDPLAAIHVTVNHLVPARRRAAGECWLPGC